MVWLPAVIAQRDRWPTFILGSKWFWRRTRSTEMAQRYCGWKNSSRGAGRWFHFDRTLHYLQPWTCQWLWTCQDAIYIYYHQVVAPLLLDHLDLWGGSLSNREPSLYGYYRSFSLVSSRSFLVDAYHGLSMVPIADALVVVATWIGYAWLCHSYSFNHVQENHVHLEVGFQLGESIFYLNCF